MFCFRKAAVLLSMGVAIILRGGASIFSLAGVEVLYKDGFFVMLPFLQHSKELKLRGSFGFGIDGSSSTSGGRLSAMAGAGGVGLP